MRFSLPFAKAPLAVFWTLLLVACSSIAQTPARITESIAGSSPVKIAGSTPAALRQAVDLGAVDSSTALHKMVLVLQPSEQQKQDLKSLIAAQSDPKSSQYHQWLRPEEFAARFAPAATDLAKVRAWLKAQGFTIDEVAKGGLWIQFSGSASQVASTFQTEVHRYRIDGQERTANASDISLPGALTSVVSGISSLNNIPRKPMHTPFTKVTLDTNGKLAPAGIQANGKPTPEYSSASGTHYLTPSDVATIYDTKALYAGGTDGTGVTVAIIGETDIQLADIQTFRQIFGLAANDPEIVLVGPDPGVVSDDEGESDLDLEYVGAMAPNAHVKFVEAGSTSTTAGIDLAAAYAVDNVAAPILSLSYGACEATLGDSGNLFYSSLWGQAAAQGMTVFVSAGDSGSAGCDAAAKGIGATEGLQVSGLASTPYNVAVGGTQFNESAARASTFWNSSNDSTNGSAIGYIPEAVWNESCDVQTDSAGCSVDGSYTVLYGGSGGKSSCLHYVSGTGDLLNCSVGYPKPEWQVGTGVPADGVRDIPDVSLAAAFQHDGYLVCDEGTCQTIYQNGKLVLSQASVVGGTSAAAPAMAGIMALVEQKNGLYQGQANYIYYKLAAAQNTAACNSTLQTSPSSTSGCVFHDITTGTNSVPCTGATADCSSTLNGVDGTLNGYSTTAGFDLATGLGSVDGSNLVNNWSSVSLLTSATTLSAGQTSVVHGTTVTFNVGVTPASGSGVPSGQVSLSANAQGIGPFALTNGQYVGSTQLLPGGTYALKAHYAGSGIFAESDSNAVPITVTPEASTVSLNLYYVTQNSTLANISGSVSYGSYLYATASIAGASGQGTPTGTLTILLDGTSLGQFSVDSSGSVDIFIQSYLSNGTVAPGAHLLTATYSGDASFNPSSAGAGSAFTVSKGIGYAQAYANQSSAKSGQPLQIYLTVTNESYVPPTGTMQLYDNGVALGPLQTLASNGPQGSGIAQAEYSVSSLAVGTHVLTATYSGDANYASIAQGSSQQLTYTVTVTSATLTPSQTRIGQSAVSISAGQSITYTVQVTGSSSGASTAIPTGTVALTNPNPGVFTSAIGSTVTLVNGTATIAVPFYLAGPLEVYASYSGDSKFDPSTSSVLLTTIQTIAPAVTIVPNAVAVLSGQQSSLNFTVTGKPNNASYAIPTGYVQYYDQLNGGTAQLIGNDAVSVGNGRIGVDSFAVKLATGSHIITASYGGDSTWSAAEVQTTVTVGTPDFSIGSANGTYLLPVGGSASGAVTVTPTLGYTGTVSLACSTGLPVGVSCTITPSSLALSGSTTATVTLASAAAHAALLPLPLDRRGLPQEKGLVLAGLGLAGACCLRRRRALAGTLGSLTLLCGLGLFAIGCTSNSVTAASGYVVNLTSQNGTKTVQGSSVQLLASVSGNAGGTVNGGTVTFYDGSSFLASSTVTNGTASLTTSSMGVGVHTITAIYVDSRSITATSNAISQAITGTFVIQVTATSGALTHSTPLTLQLQ